MLDKQGDVNMTIVSATELQNNFESICNMFKQEMMLLFCVTEKRLQD